MDRQALTQLGELLVQHFNIAELRGLCFNLNVDFEELESHTKTTKVQDLIMYLERRGELDQLLKEVTKLRPLVKWPDFEIPPSDIFTNEKTGLVMVRIEEGEFIYQDNRILYLPEYWISKTPVTNRHYARFVTAKEYDPPRHWQGKYPPRDLADHPVAWVNWRDAMAYCEWANLQLPSEEQWEKAARGPNGNKYPWGNEWKAGYCNINEPSIDGTTPVGKYSPHGDSHYGCVDMVGNVWEWVGGKMENDLGRRALRGGSWYDKNYIARVTVRVDRSLSSYGFRVVDMKRI